MRKGLETANKRIRALRQALQMTRIEFCEETGIKLTTLENIEKDKQRVHDEHFQAIAKKWPEYTVWLVTGEAPRVTQLPPNVAVYIAKLKRSEESGIKDAAVEEVRESLIRDKKKKLD